MNIALLDGLMETKKLSAIRAIKEKDQISNLVYEARWEAYSMTELENHLNTIISDETYLNLNLPLTYSGFNLEWSSNKPDVITNEGIYIALSFRKCC